AGAVAVGSGASFTSQSAHTVAVTSGSLSHANDHNGGTLSIDGIKPGDTRTGSLTLKNDGTLDSTLTLQETKSTNSFAAGALKLKITKAGTDAALFDGNFGDLDDATKVDLGALKVGASTTVNFEVSMPESADNTNQGKSAGASYSYVTTQVK
ncbi:hypothetical protein QT636_22575, partial [Xanthomonas citri pv. citri]